MLTEDEAGKNQRPDNAYLVVSPASIVPKTWNTI